MTTGEVAYFPLPKAGKKLRKRGRTVMSCLGSTSAFTHDTLAIPERMLILFLLVVLVDEHGSLATFHERLAAAADKEPGHWARGRSKERLPNSTNKWLGKYALRPPPWERLEEFLRLRVRHDHLPLIRAIAAGLHCQVTGQARPEGYEGPLYVPGWARGDSATPEAIRENLQTLLAPPEGTSPAGPSSAAVADSAELDMLSLIKERDDLKTLLGVVVRDFRAMQEYAERQRTEAEQARRALETQQEQFVEHHQLIVENKQVRRQMNELRELYARLQIRLNSGLSRTTVEQMITDQLHAAMPSHPRPQWEWITKTPHEPPPPDPAAREGSTAS
ncbi:hypothetical protein [Amycolatopsis sp. NPDC051716]|uniref:hypothetical protein n=1 Tax=Amycolatopsis sp. NPDC051716 TaxID=3155804 RepID=UPI0034424F95